MRRILGTAAFSAATLIASALVWTAPVGAATGQAPADQPRDFRAAVLAAGTTTSTGAQTMSSVYSGAIAAGAAQNWYLGNVATDAVYHIGLSPTGASTSAPCSIRVERTWQVQLTSGERQFQFRIKNIGSIACGTDILFTALTSHASPWTGALEPGASTSRVWNNANPLDAAYLVNVSPSGATSSNACQFEVTRVWYQQQPGGERELLYTVRNSGTIACTAKVLLAKTSTSNSSWATGTIAAGATKGWTWNNANPLNRVYVLGLSPLGATGSTACQLEVTVTSYQQNINSDGSTEREYHFTVKNVGSLACSGNLLLNYLTA